MRALVTGFEPFGGDSVNASLEAVRRLPARVGAIEVSTAELPTSFTRARAALEAAIARIDPAVVLAVGQAGERAALCVERIAVNIQYAEIADNDGGCPLDCPVVPGGPAAYLSTLPVRNMVAALQRAGLPAQLSMSAGTFVCNHVFYGLMHFAATGRFRYRGGFLHVPALKGTGSGTGPALALDDIVRGIEVALGAAAAPGPDAGP